MLRKVIEIPIYDVMKDYAGSPVTNVAFIFLDSITVIESIDEFSVIYCGSEKFLTQLKVYEISKKIKDSYNSIMEVPSLIRGEL